MRRKFNPYQQPMAFAEANEVEAYDLKVGPYVFLQTTYDGNLFHAPGQMFVTKQWIYNFSKREKNRHKKSDHWSVRKIKYQHRTVTEEKWDYDDA
tara:strand:+ start:1548 stop:1832 length:285 start_codon:yes stop_codon:yes gene_type:complete